MNAPSTDRNICGIMDGGGKKPRKGMTKPEVEHFNGDVPQDNESRRSSKLTSHTKNRTKKETSEALEPFAKRNFLSLFLASSSNDAQRTRELAELNQQCEALLKQLGNDKLSQEALESSGILTFYKRQRRKHLFRRACYAVISLAFFFGLAWLLVETKLAGALFRRGLIQILPVWDWSYLREVPCFLENHRAGEDFSNITNSHCVVCEDLGEIYERKRGAITAFQVGEDFLVEELPLIIRGAVDVDPNHMVLQHSNLLKLHLEDENIDPCRFRTNLRTKSAFQFESFLRKVARKDMRLPWFAFWEFCKRDDVKEVRVVVPRPEELPLMLEIADSVWFFMATNMTGLTYKQVELSAPVFWLTQISGTCKVKLVPKGVCETVCQNLIATLHPGDMLLMTSDLFDIGWMPGPEHNVLGVAAGASHKFPEICDRTECFLFHRRFLLRFRERLKLRALCFLFGLQRFKRIDFP